MSAAEANKRQAEIWARDVNHENDLMRPFSGDAICQAHEANVAAFCKTYGVTFHEDPHSGRNGADR